MACDGIAIIVNPDNPVSDLSVEQHRQDLHRRDHQLEGRGRQRCRDRSASAVRPASGTRDGFESITGTKDACQYRQELTSTGDVITAVARTPMPSATPLWPPCKDSVKALTVDGVTPTEDTVKDGSYAMQRPFVLVTKDGHRPSPPRHRPSSTTPPPLTRRTSSPRPAR